MINTIADGMSSEHVDILISSYVFYCYIADGKINKNIRMRGNILPHIKKLILIGIVLILVDFSGIIVHLFELDYQRHFNYPSNNKAIGSDGNLHTTALVTVDNNYTFIYDLSNHCQDAPHLTILIKSAIKNVDQRNAIRRTWGFEQRFSDVTVKRVFLLGITMDLPKMRKLNEEVDKYKDIVMLNFLDTYFNNTIKTLSGMRWALNFCANGRYFMFVDDDYYVSVKNVLKFLAHPAMYPKITTNMGIAERESDYSQMPKNRNLFAGYALQTSPHRHKFGKWYVSLREYPYDLWPPYITAGAFILSQDALFTLYNSSLHIKMFRFDDVFLGIAAVKAELPLTHCEMFHFYKPKYSSATSYRYVIASHGFEDPNELQKVWNECRSAGFA